MVTSSAIHAMNSPGTGDDLLKANLHLDDITTYS
jgi:hypothetical protein